MKRCISSSRRLAAAVIAVLAMMFTGSVFAQTVDQVLQADQRRLNLAQQSQERINKIVEELGRGERPGLLSKAFSAWVMILRLRYVTVTERCMESITFLWPTEASW